MKKGLFTIITAVFALINLVLTSILIFAIVPTMNESVKVIEKISNIIDLESNTTTNSTTDVPIDYLESYDIEDSMTISLQTSTNTQHYAVLNVTLYLNTQHKDYATYHSAIDKQEALIKSTIIDTVSKYTLEQVRENKESIQTEALEKIRAIYDSDFVYQVVFSNVTLQ